MQEITAEQIQIALGERIRALRKRAGYSQESFADATGLHRTWMGSVERGERNLSFHNLFLVAKTLQITLSKLLSGVETRAAELAKTIRSSDYRS